MLEQETLDELKKLNARLELAFPSPTDLDAWVDGSVTLTAGQSATITFTMKGGYKILISDLYSDNRALTNYSWQLPGKMHTSSLVSYSRPAEITNPDQVILTISNADGIAHTYNYYIKARAVRT